MCMVVQLFSYCLSYLLNYINITSWYCICKFIICGFIMREFIVNILCIVDWGRKEDHHLVWSLRTCPTTIHCWHAYSGGGGVCARPLPLPQIRGLQWRRYIIWDVTCNLVNIVYWNSTWFIVSLYHQSIGL